MLGIQLHQSLPYHVLFHVYIHPLPATLPSHNLLHQAHSPPTTYCIYHTPLPQSTALTCFVWSTISQCPRHKKQMQRTHRKYLLTFTLLRYKQLINHTSMMTRLSVYITWGNGCMARHKMWPLQSIIN